MYCPECNYIYHIREADNQDDNDSKSNAYYECDSCGNSEPIQPLSIIYSKQYGNINKSDEDDHYLSFHDSTLSRTKQYICPNKSCKTHGQPEKKSAAITKDSGNQIVHICDVCKIHWNY